MHAEKRRKTSLATNSEPQSGRKHKLPDPPDPDNLPIDYAGVGWDSSKLPPSTPRTLRPQHRSHGRNGKS